ncbi:sugar transferase [Halobacillus litoralis]|uniref:Sugar transferase n=1 Tax=Halobacillus litoralis TaxID=45668 RepID=A0A410MFH7_9BACI|nr:sugar transferase [Halobacillus litoralis]QAS53450.1 sugar transferase [Halobacillus litoralis]
MKRLVDLIISVFAFIFFIPLLFIVGILIKIEDRGPVIFKQNRGGIYQKHFEIYKFRTMVQNAENIGLKYKTEENDTRITKVGMFLRKYSIDELPQLINIIKGDMSVVGPRPALPVHTDNYNKYQLKRLQVKPGVTGLAQIKGRNNLSWDEKINWDIKYVEKHSIWLDIKIILKTVKIVFNKKNIYQK